MKILATLSVLVLASGPASAQQQKPSVEPARLEAAMQAAWPKTGDWQARLQQDATMKECTAHDNNPATAIADAIRKREQATIQYPENGQFLGDWKRGEAIAQSGYGMRFTDYPATRANGGNCYACHQITKAELSFGTIGPSLLEYGKLRDFKDAEVKTTYEKIYNSHASFPCSNMPRFGTNKVLTIEQIKDVVALLMSRESPVNK